MAGSRSTPTAAEEPKLSLPVGHPQAGYVGPDLSFRDGAGQMTDEQQEAFDDMVAQHEDDVATVTENEHKVAKAELEASETAIEKATKENEKAAADASSTKSAS